MADKKWRTYEEVAQYLLNQFAGSLGLEGVEGKQEITGLRSGRVIEIDGKGIKKGGAGFLLLECKRYPKRGVEAEKLEALAYRITDAGAEGGIVVTPIGLQEGADMIAQAENVITVHMDEKSTEASYFLRFLNQVMVGVEEKIGVADVATVKIQRHNG